MGAYSTLYITRSKARKIIYEKIMGGLSDEELEKFCDEILEPRLYRCRIVDDS